MLVIDLTTRGVAGRASARAARVLERGLFGARGAALCVSAAGAQSAAPAWSGGWPGQARHRVLYDEQEPGELWARGADYKAGFGPGGTSFVPFLGSSAPRGCHNSSGTAARLIGSGAASLANDSVQLASDGLLPNGLLIFNQGTTVVAPIQFGQGLRCVGGTTKRLYTSSSQAGAAVAPPLPSDPSLHERSAALGDPITAGTSRYYYVYYRDPIVFGSCANSLTYNTSASLQVIWTP